MSRPPHDRSRRGVEAFVRDWLDVAGGRLGLGVRAEISRRRDDLTVTLTADGRGFGPRRTVQVASALQTLLEAAIGREGFREGVEVVLASEPGAAAVEAQGLMAAVRTAAQQAAQRGRPFALGPMSVADRRQIHQALGEIGQVWTQSEGDGIFRRLWVIPRNQVAGRSAESKEPKGTPDSQQGG
jgi:predicted RNA-binding protein Jag